MAQRPAKKRTHKRAPAGYRHSKRELLLYGLLLVGSCVAGYVLEQWRHDAEMEQMWDAAERRGHAHRVYDGPFDSTPERRWNDGPTPR